MRRYPMRLPVWYIVPLVAVALAFYWVGGGGARQPVPAVTSVVTSVLTSTSVQTLTSVQTSMSVQTSTVVSTVQVVLAAPPAAASTVAAISPTSAPPPSTPVPAAPPAAPKAPTPTAAPKSGTVLYQADWSGGLGGWAGQGWAALNGMLLNDGSDVDTGMFKRSWTPAPFQPTVGDYAVEASIQVVRPPECGSYGVVARSGYQGGIQSCDVPNLAIRTARGDEIASRAQDPGVNWHTYRLEVRGNVVVLYFDGGPLEQVSDNGYLSPGGVGIWDDRTQINVRGFKLVI